MYLAGIARAKRERRNVRGCAVAHMRTRIMAQVCLQHSVGPRSSLLVQLYCRVRTSLLSAHFSGFKLAASV